MPLIFAFIVGVLAALPTFAQTIERPAVKVGDECHFDVFDNLRKDDRGEVEKIAERHGVVTSVEGDRIVINWTQKLLVSRDTEDLEEGMWVYYRDLNVVERNGRKYDPAYPSRFYPVTPGAEKKDAKTSFPRMDGDGQTTTKLDGKASNWQNIVVPAGKFDVVTLTWDGYYNTRRTAGESWSGGVYQEIALSPATWCPVKGVFRTYRARGGVWSDRTYKLTGSKN